MKYLVTGAAGFIGYHLAKELSKKHIVYGIDNLNNYYSKDVKIERLITLKKNKNFKFIKLNLINWNSLSKFIKNKKFETIFHLAAQPGVQYSLKNRKSYFDNNLKAQFNLLESIVKFKVTNKFIYGSSSSVYGEKSNKSETFKLEKQESFYAATKNMCEIMTKNYSNLYKFKATGLRFFTVYGPYGRPDMSPLIFLKSIYKNQKINLFNNGSSLRSFTYISDVINFIVQANKNTLFNLNKKYYHKIYNVGNNSNISTYNFLKLIEKNLKKKGNIIKLKNRTADIKNTKANINLAIKELGVKLKISPKIGVKKLCDWYLGASINFK
jgi:UDP-glucuronate 4-epimerase